MVIPCVGHSYSLSYNHYVLSNTPIPDLTTKKKNQSIAYYFIYDRAASDQWITSYVNTHNNETDLLTTLLPSGDKRKGLVRRLMLHNFS